MNGEQLARELGEISAAIKHSTDKIDHISERLDNHIQDEEARLKFIENQLSFGRFVFFALKAIGLTFLLILTFKLGDISAVWKTLLK